MARVTAEEIIAKRQAEQAAVRKLAESPEELTRSDVLDLPAGSLTDALASGALVHLGYGADRRRRR